jgi:hypothetical protein
MGRWHANIPINMVDQFVTNLNRLDVAFDIGTQDRLLEANLSVQRRAKAK